MSEGLGSQPIESTRCCPGTVDAFFGYMGDLSTARRSIKPT